MITKLFIPVPKDDKYDFLDKVYQLALQYGFCDTNHVTAYARLKKKRIEQLKEIVKDQTYLTLGFKPEIPSNVDGHLYQWTTQFKKTFLMIQRR